MTWVKHRDTVGKIAQETSPSRGERPLNVIGTIGSSTRPNAGNSPCGSMRIVRGPRSVQLPAGGADGRPR